MKARPADAAEVTRLVEVFRKLHGCEATHEGSVHIRETFRGEVAWEGDVEVFALAGHPTATHGYAWSHESDSGGRNYVAVLRVPPVTSPLRAVQAVIANEARKLRARA